MKIGAAALLALIAAGCAPASPPPATAKRADVFAKSAGAVLALEPAVTKGKLANGLTYYILRNARPEKRVQLWLAVNAGSVFEDPDQRGLAHFVEHMAFNGTRRFPKNELIEFLERSGVRFGADVNAHTGFDETVYQVQLPTDRPELVGRGLMVLRDWADGVTFDPAEIDKERNVILEEWRTRLGPNARMEDRRVSENPRASRYSTRQPIGKMDIIATAPPRALTRFYHDWYRPDRMAVVVVGDVDPADVELRLRAEFASFKGPKPERQLPDERITFANDTMTVSVETDPGLSEVRANIVNVFAHRVLLRENDYRHRVVDQLWNTMMNARLGEVERQPGTPFFSAVSTTIHPIRPVDGFLQAATLRESGTTEGLTALFREVVRVGQHGFVPGELARAKATLLRGGELRAVRANERDSASLAAQIARDFTSEETIPSPTDELALLRRFLPDIGLLEMNKVTALLAQGRRITVTGPPSMAKPTEEAIRASLRTVLTAALPPYVDIASPTPLMARPTTSGAVVATRAFPEIGVTEWTLANGVRVVLKPTSHDGIRMHAFAPGGTSLASDADYGSARFAGDLIELAGLGALDASALRRSLAGTSVRFHAGIVELAETLDGSAVADETEPMLQLANLAFTGARRDPGVFAAWRDRAIETRRSRQLSPDAAFAEEMPPSRRRWPPSRRRTIPGGAPRPRRSSERSTSTRRLHSTRTGSAMRRASRSCSRAPSIRRASSRSSRHISGASRARAGKRPGVIPA